MEKIRMRHILQVFKNDKISDVPIAISQEFNKIKLDQKIKPGMRIGITVGSRGIDNIQLIIKSIIQEVKKRKGIPYILPAMGSHGGAIAEGQKKLLAGYGITEESMGVHIKATMDVVKIGELENSLPVYFDKYAFHADGIIVVNRIKVHTAFKGEIESGLNKMLAVGLGNQKGASLVHYLGIKGLRDNMVEFARVILNKAPIICGLGILENGYGKTYKLIVANPEDFERVDKELLRECKKILPRLPVSDIDILIVEEMGKNISGPGMDTNIIGGIKEYKKEEFNPPQIKKILVLDLTLETHGNALGVGYAHIITRKLYRKIDFKTTYANTITVTFLERSRIPLIVDTEREALDIALKTIWNLPGTKPRIIIIRNTLKLDEMYVSEAIWEDIRDKDNIVSKGNLKDLNFDKEGNLSLRI